MCEADDSTLEETHDMSNERHSFAAGVSSLVLYFAWVESAKAEVYIRSGLPVRGSQGERKHHQRTARSQEAVNRLLQGTYSAPKVSNQLQWP